MMRPKTLKECCDGEYYRVQNVGKEQLEYLYLQLDDIEKTFKDSLIITQMKNECNNQIKWIKYFFNLE